MHQKEVIPSEERLLELIAQGNIPNVSFESEKNEILIFRTSQKDAMDVVKSLHKDSMEAHPNIPDFDFIKQKNTSGASGYVIQSSKKNNQYCCRFRFCEGTKQLETLFDKKYLVVPNQFQKDKTKNVTVARLEKNIIEYITQNEILFSINKLKALVDEKLEENILRKAVEDYLANVLYAEDWSDFPKLQPIVLFFRQLFLSDKKLHSLQVLQNHIINLKKQTGPQPRKLESKSWEYIVSKSIFAPGPHKKDVLEVIQSGDATIRSFQSFSGMNDFISTLEKPEITREINARVINRDISSTLSKDEVIELNREEKTYRWIKEEYDVHIMKEFPEKNLVGYENSYICAGSSAIYVSTDAEPFYIEIPDEEKFLAKLQELNPELKPRTFRLHKNELKQLLPMTDAKSVSSILIDEAGYYYLFDNLPFGVICDRRFQRPAKYAYHIKNGLTRKRPWRKGVDGSVEGTDRLFFSVKTFKELHDDVNDKTQVKDQNNEVYEHPSKDAGLAIGVASEKLLQDNSIVVGLVYQSIQMQNIVNREVPIVILNSPDGPKKYSLEQQRQAVEEYFEGNPRLYLDNVAKDKFITKDYFDRHFNKQYPNNSRAC